MPTMSQFIKSKKISSPAVTAGQKNAIKLFHEMASRVPAYRSFLKDHGVNPKQVTSHREFVQLPIMDKQNYLTKYPLKDLAWDGDLFSSRIISVSSGSTGAPFFWPRGEAQDEEGGWMHEQLFQKVFNLGQGTTLVVVCFSMGTWIAGSFTTASAIRVANKGFKLNIVTPGIMQEDAINSIKHLGQQYDRIVLAGYPPFLKDVLDLGTREGIKWHKYKLKLLFAGESFSEEWRDHVLKLARCADVYRDSINIYGSADAAMLGHETPITIALRRLYSRRPALAKAVFGTDIIPTLVQYYPRLRFFEGVGGELVFSANAGLPLLRYNIHDTGGILSLDDAIAPVSAQFGREVRKNQLNPADWPLPFIYLGGRKDFTATIYAVNIYPENIKAALVDPSLRGWVTGKFTMATKYKSDMDQYFEVNIELAKDNKATAHNLRLAKKTILQKLGKLNAEFHKLHTAIGKKAEPKIHLIDYGDKRYFGRGVKHRWVQK